MDINRHDITMMELVDRMSQLSYAIRRKVGAALVRDRRIVLNGYNGTIAGTSNDCEDVVGFKCPYCNSGAESINHLYDVSINKENIAYKCKKCGVYTYVDNETKTNSLNEYDIVKITPVDFKELVTNDFVLHAEQNIICYAARKGIPTEGCDLYVTLSPCKNCAKLIAQSGIKRVFFKDLYRDDSGVKFLENLGIEIIQIKKQ